MIITNKKILLEGALLLFSFFVTGQNVGINTTGATPSNNAILDLNTGNNYNLGLILPHVELANTTKFNSPMANAKSTKDTGMLVYNTNGPMTTGCYYWTGNKWVNLLSSLNGAWTISGNANIIDGTNFIGTTNTAPINFQINGNKAGRIDGI